MKRTNESSEEESDEDEDSLDSDIEDIFQGGTISTYLYIQFIIFVFQKAKISLKNYDHHLQLRSLNFSWCNFV